MGILFHAAEHVELLLNSGSCARNGISTERKNGLSSKLRIYMQHIKASALVFLLALFATGAQASLVTWDFAWERTARSNTYGGIGMFSYDSSAGNHVTHGGSRFGDLDDELTAFSFEGFVNSESIGVTNALPALFDFSANIPVVWAMAANKFRYSLGAGVGCILNTCSLYEDGDRARKSAGMLTLTRRDNSTTLAEPGTLILTSLGMLLIGVFGWRRKSI